jgi:bacteriocin-like protein
MTKKAQTPDALLDDAKITLTEISDKELEKVTGGDIVLQHEKVTGADTSGPKFFRIALEGKNAKLPF